MMKRVLARIKSEGPLKARDFEDKGRKRTGWWDWKPAKTALELLYYHGDLMIHARDGFEKYYDLTERVLPSQIDTSVPTIEEFCKYLIDSTVKAHGFGAYRTFSAGARYGVPLAGSLKKALQQATEAGELILSTSDSGDQIYMKPAEGRSIRAQPVVRILSPFDNLVSQRERLAAVFNFDYQIECFVPEAKRQYGYYCLPILYGDQLVGRMDCKSHRDKSHFQIKALYLESGFTKRQAVEELATPLARAIVDYAQYDQCTSIEVTRCTPALAKPILTRALAAT